MMQSAFMSVFTQRKSKMLMCGDQRFTSYHQQIAEELSTLWVTNNTVLYEAGVISSAVPTTCEISK